MWSEDCLFISTWMLGARGNELDNQDQRWKWAFPGRWPLGNIHCFKLCSCSGTDSPHRQGPLHSESTEQAASAALASLHASPSRVCADQR